MKRAAWTTSWMLALAGIARAQSPSPPATPAPPSGLTALRAEAGRLEPHVRAAWVKQFLRATGELTPVPARVFYRTADRTRALPEQDALALPEAERAALQRIEVDEEAYYSRISTPLAYARPLDILAEAGFAPRGRKLVDFGYGNVGQLKLLALLGADAAGIEVDPMLPLLYAAENGPVRAKDGTRGRLKVLHGRFPTDAALVSALGGGYDLFLSKNTLKRGYVHPEKPVPDRQRIDLGVSDAEYVRAVHRLLKPGGFFLIYNLAPAPAPPDKPYLPWADGRSPFPLDTMKAEGFEVIAFDRDDSAAARTMGHALGWDAGEQPMDLEKDLFGMYTLARRK
jgi:SAM-dependent methyltransferase